MWAPIECVAQIAEISNRKARNAASRAFREGTTWRGATLTVRTVRGRGGRSGLRYEVLVSSLPFDLQERFNAAQRLAATPLEPVAASSAEREWWHLLLRPALVHPKRSQERGAAITAILSRPLTDWTGKEIAPSRRTLERQMAAYEQHGLMGLARHHRQDKGQARVLISRAWDAAAPFTDDVKAEVAGRLRDYIRGLYKDGAGFGIIARLASEKLRDLSNVYLRRSHGIDCDTEALIPSSICKLPRSFIEAEARFRIVATFKRDRKAYEDRERPRVSRTSAGMWPMDLVVGDVHHLDIVMKREDGSEAWPKLIAWADQATHRVRVDVVLLEKGEGIRNADVIRSFIAMTQDETWGMPHMLYLDNGSEYRWPEFVDDAMKLVRAHTPGFISSIGYLDRRDKAATVRAKPYNAAAKLIEGIFGHLERHIFNTIPGWVGGDRMNKKTAKVGRPTEPFPGDITALKRVIASCMTLYHDMPQAGDLKKRSPADAYRTALAEGWQRVTIDPNELRSVFATEKVVKPRKGCISFGGRDWTCDALTAHIGKAVTIRIPKYEEPSVLPLLDEAGALIGFAEPVEVFAVLDQRGAKEAERRARLKQAAVAQLGRSASDVSTTEEIVKSAERIPAMPAAPIVAHITVNAEVARGLAEDPEDRAERQRRVKQQEGRERLATLERARQRIAGGRA